MNWLTSTQSFKKLQKSRAFKQLKQVFEHSVENLKNYWGETIKLFWPRYYPLLMREELKIRCGNLSGLTRLDAEQKKRIDKYTVRKMAKRLGRLYILEKRWHRLRKLLYDTAIIVFILLAGIFYQRYHFFLHHAGYKDYLGKGFSDYISVAGPVIIFLIVFDIFFRFLSRHTTLIQRLLFIFILVLVALLNQSGIWRFRAEYDLYSFGLMGYQIITLISIFVDTLINFMFDQFTIRQYPEEVVVNNILVVLRWVDLDYAQNLYFKRQCAVRLEYAAEFVEKHIYQNLKTADPDSNTWIKERTHQIASALREKKKWIFTPTPRTERLVLSSLADFLIHFINKEWGQLEKLELPQKAPKETWRNQLGQIIKTLLVGLIPISVIMVLQYFKLVTFNETIIGIAVIWFIVNFIWLDPTAKEKINAVKDTAGLVQSKPKE